MVRDLYQERNEIIEGEGSKIHKEGEGSSGGHNDEDKSKKGNGGNGDTRSRHHHPHIHLHQPLHHLQYIILTMSRTRVKVLF